MYTCIYLLFATSARFITAITGFAIIIIIIKKNEKKKKKWHNGCASDK